MNPRSVILLTLAVLVPAVALGVLGFVLLDQQREMVRLRQQDGDLLAARITADSLGARLERAAASAAVHLQEGPYLQYPGPDSLLFLGRVEDGRFVPPYPPRPSTSLESRPFSSWLSRHRRLEQRGGSVEQQLRSLDRTPEDSLQAAYLAFMKGRTLLTAGREGEGRALLQQVAAMDLDVTDEEGNPMAFYAVDLLGPETLTVPDSWLRPVARYWLQDLDSLALAEEYEALDAVSAVAAGVDGWRRLGPNWLAGRHGDHLFGVRLRHLPRFAPERSVQPAGGSGAAPSLAPTFPDLVMLPSQVGQGASPLWGAALGLMVFLSAMAGLLLFRDQRREKRLAALRSKFVSSVSHEVRTPLSAIRLYTESLLAYGPGEDEKDWREDLGTIARETSRLTRMLDNVLTFSRVERGVQQYTLDEGRLDRVLESTARVMQPALKEAGCSFTQDLTPVQANFDADAIQQALINLLSNAARYAPGRNVTLGCRQDGDNAEIEVLDDGDGLSAEDAERVFEPFYRARNGVDTGTGLGLSIVQHVAVGHHGEASVACTPGEGCRFSISFPITP